MIGLVVSLILALVCYFHNVPACKLVNNEPTKLLTDEVCDLKVVNAGIIFYFDGAVFILGNLLKNSCIKLVILFFIAMAVI